MAPSSIPRSIIILWLGIINSGSIILVIYHLIKTHGAKEKKQAVLVAMGVIVPIVFANISQILFPIFKVQIPELTTVGTALQGMFIGFAIWRYDLFALNPITAANNIVSTMSDLLILLSPSGKIASINRAVTDLLNYQEKDLIQKPITEVLSGKVVEHPLFMKTENNKEPEMKAPTETTPLRNLEGILIAKDGQHIPTSVAVSTLWNRDNTLAGYVVIARDVTEQKQIEAEREGLITELQEALSSIKVLRGLLPICSVCKKIRDDQGYWQQVDVFIREHTEVDFSHSICETCAKALYPDMHEKILEGRKPKEHP
jgi:PAS domain S-box-containing protein